MSITKLHTLIAVAILSVFGFSSASAQNFQAVTVDGNTTASGAAASVVYDSGTFHMWYRTDTPAGEIGGLHYATSTNGLNFTTQGAPLSFSNNPFPSGTPPYIYYENVSLVSGDYKIQHWTYNGGDGSYPAYN